MINNELNLFQDNGILEIKNLFTFHTYRPGQVIFYQEHQPYGLFILLDGVVEIVNSKKKKKKVASPAFLGIESFLNLSEYSFTAKAMTKCDVSFLSNTAYKQSGLDIDELKNMYSEQNS